MREVDYCSAASLMVRRRCSNSSAVSTKRSPPPIARIATWRSDARAGLEGAVSAPVARGAPGRGLARDRYGQGIKRHQVINQRRFVQRWAEGADACQSAPGCRVLRARDRAMDRPMVLVVDHYVPEPDRDAGSSP